MRIGIDTRLKSESGVGRYIRNLTSRLPVLDKKNDYTSIQSAVRWHTMAEQIVMPYVYKKSRAHLVHIPYFNVPLLYRDPFVVTIHDVIIDTFPTGRASTQQPLLYRLKRRAYKYTMRHALRWAKAVIVPSKATKREILRLYDVPREKLHVIYEGADDSIARPKKSQGLALARGSFVLYVGNAYPHKNIETLIEAFTLFVKKQTGTSNIKLVLVGKEDYFFERLKERVSKRSIRDRVVFPGYVSDAHLSWLYSNALCLVCPSRMEGFGLPALEAMRNNCLVLASSIPVFHELYGDACLYFDTEDAASLSLLLSRVYSSREKFSALKEKGEKRSRAYSWEKMVQETIEVYEHCHRL